MWENDVSLLDKLTIQRQNGIRQEPPCTKKLALLQQIEYQKIVSKTTSWPMGWLVELQLLSANANWQWSHAQDLPCIKRRFASSEHHRKFPSCRMHAASTVQHRHCPVQFPPAMKLPMCRDLIASKQSGSVQYHTHLLSLHAYLLLARPLVAQRAQGSAVQSRDENRSHDPRARR